jgi:hypothetical protein
MLSQTGEREEAVLAALDSLILTQSEHLNSFAEGDLTQLFSRINECENIFSRLKNNFAYIEKKSFVGSAEFRRLFQEKIQRIKHGEERLLAEVGKQRDIIQQNLKKLRTGRKVLSCYSLKGEISSPRFVSNRS